MEQNDDQEHAIPCTLMRAGMSKGVFLRADDVPPPGAQLDALLKALMGSQDALQIHGLGGSRLVTAKLAIVGRSARDDADVDYTYAIVPPERDIVSKPATAATSWPASARSRCHVAPRASGDVHSWLA